MNGESGMIEIALGFEASLTNEFVVLRFAVLGRLLAKIGKQANGLEVNVEDGVCVGKQPNGIRSSPLAQQHGGGDGAENNKDGDYDPECTATTSHG